MELREYLFRRRMTVTDFAKVIKISRVYLNGIVSGRVIPSQTLASLIESVTKGEVMADEMLKNNKEYVPK